MTSDHPWLEMAASGRLDELPVLLLKEVRSTNEVAGKMAGEGALANTVVVAESQTGGRGRLGKKWQSPPGTGLYCSIVLRPALAPDDLPKITLAAGLAVSRAITGVSGLPILLKWPNDLLLAGRKLGGILAEVADLYGQSGPAVVLGIGLNINSPLSSFPAALHEKATSLFIHTRRQYRRSAFLAAIVAELKIVISRFEREGFANILAEWRQLDATLGRELSWVTQAGHIVRGVSMGPDDSGQLLIRDQSGRLHEVLSGDIDLLKNS